MTLSEQADRVQTRDDLIRFIYHLTDDLETNAGEWENPHLDLFLEAMARWTRDMDGYFLNRREPVPEQPSWNLLASIILAAKYYE